MKGDCVDRVEVGSCDGGYLLVFYKAAPFEWLGPHQRALVGYQLALRVEPTVFRRLQNHRVIFDDCSEHFSNAEGPMFRQRRGRFVVPERIING